MALLLHAISDSTLLAEVQQEVAIVTEANSQPATWVKEIEQQPLLLSMYAETLRHGVQIHIPRDIPHQSLTIGNRTIPRDQILFVNTWLAHTDQAVWNTKDGIHPTNEFWARRFIIDPKDPSSGPCKKQGNFNGTPATVSDSTSKPWYSTEGLEGAWVPYGGKTLMWLLQLDSLNDTRWPSCLSWQGAGQAYNASIMCHDDLHVRHRAYDRSREAEISTLTLRFRRTEAYVKGCF
ncbi:MAG: hypothetical protein L6R42_001605 [Xanthoria sp. 1 TBL-2021]|nr:MAG: hypothetical protein L6R42_001605 [Xanthoria sp. 1 TBL-2021]